MKITNISGSKGILLAALVFLLVLPWGAYAAGTDIGIYLNGEKAASDVSPYIDGNSRTMVPLRFIAESTGAYVEWNMGTQIITIKQQNCEMELTIGSSKALVDNRTVQLDTQPVLKDGRTMVPLRFVSEQLGCLVSWNVQQQSVYINTREAVEKELVVAVSSVANIRKGPGTTYPVITTVKNGAVLDAIGISAGWYEILLADNSKGWISATIVQPKGEQDDEDQEEPEEPGEEDPGDNNGDTGDIAGNSVIMITDSVNIRQSPSADSPKIGVAYSGQELAALGEQGDWFKVKTSDGQTGYIANWLAAYKKEPSNSSGSLRGKIIVIDPGHGSLQSGGGSDPGAVSPSGYYERDINIRIASAAGKVLSDNGATVIYTRMGSKTSITLKGRAQVANNLGADAFVSIHCNSSTSSTPSGTSTYYYTKGKDAWLQQECKRLATLVQEELVAALGRKNLGIIDQNLAVTRETIVPSILVETAFLSNAAEEQLLSNYDFQEKAGKAVAEGVMRFLED